MEAELDFAVLKLCDAVTRKTVPNFCMIDEAAIEYLKARGYCVYRYDPDLRNQAGQESQDSTCS